MKIEQIQTTEKAKAVSANNLMKGFLYLVSVHVLVGVAAMNIAINTQQSLMLI